MYRDGLLEETRALLDQGYSESGPGLSVIGYRDAATHVRGKIDLAEAKQRTFMATRRYAKRQKNWFRSVAGLAWLAPDTSTDTVVFQLRKRRIGDISI